MQGFPGKCITFGSSLFALLVKLDTDKVEPKEKLKNLDGYSEYEDGTIRLRPGSLAESVYWAEMTGVDDYVYRRYKLELAWSFLNSVGQQKAIERIEELVEIPRYQKDPCELIQAPSPPDIETTTEDGEKPEKVNTKSKEAPQSTPDSTEGTAPGLDVPEGR